MSDAFPDAQEISDAARLAANPALSILVTTYRHELYLEQCIDSLAAQETDFPYEILVCEDNSPDGTRAVAQRMQARYPHAVRVLFTAHNKGGSLNTILGISRARAPLIALCEGDDFWVDPYKCARQVAALDAHPELDMAFTRGFRLYSDGRRVLEWDYGDEARVVQRSELLAGQGWMAPTAALMFRTRILQTLPELHAEQTWGDSVLILAGALRGGAWYDPAPTICYRVAQPTSFTARVEAMSRAERIEFLEGAVRYWKFACRFYGVPIRQIRHRIDDYRLSIAKLALAERQPVRAIKALAAIEPRFFAAGTLRRLKRWRSARWTGTA